MEYIDANYLDKNTGKICNWFDDLVQKLKADYRLQFAEWKKTWANDKEIKKLFSEKIKELNQDIWEEEKYRNNIYQNTDYNYTDKELVIARSRERAKKIEITKRRFIYYLNLCANKKQQELDIELAKQFPIGNLFTKQNKVADNYKEFFLCPLHQENTASFCWYKKTNSYYCFGCGQGGDVIDLYMKINNCDFITAVKSLCLITH